MVALTVFYLDIDLLWQLSSHEISLVGRIALATGILASCGTLAIVVLAILNRLGATDCAVHEIDSLTVYCPKCGKKQKMPLENASCAHCGLMVQIRVTEKNLDISNDPASGSTNSSVHDIYSN